MASIQQTDNDGLTILKFQGNLTESTLADIEDAVGHVARRQGARVIVDLAGVELLTTPAIAMFIAAARSARQHGGRIVFTQSNPRVADVLHRLHLEAILHTVADFEQALGQMRSHPTESK